MMHLYGDTVDYIEPGGGKEKSGLKNQGRKNQGLKNS